MQVTITEREKPVGGAGWREKEELTFGHHPPERTVRRTGGPGKPAGTGERRGPPGERRYQSPGEGQPSPVGMGGG